MVSVGLRALWGEARLDPCFLLGLLPPQVELIGLVSPQGLAVPSVASVAVDDVKFVNCDPHVVPQEAIGTSLLGGQQVPPSASG